MKEYFAEEMLKNGYTKEDLLRLEKRGAGFAAKKRKKPQVRIPAHSSVLRSSARQPSFAPAVPI
jgi:hypothetical protein